MGETFFFKNSIHAFQFSWLFHILNLFCFYLLYFTGNISIGSLHGFEVPLYFELPEQFLGDHILSFAGYFTYGIEMKECKTELDRSIIEKFPLIQIHSHGSIILEYFGVSKIIATRFLCFLTNFTTYFILSNMFLAGSVQYQSKYNVSCTIHRNWLAI